MLNRKAPEISKLQRRRAKPQCTALRKNLTVSDQRAKNMSLILSRNPQKNPAWSRPEKNLRQSWELLLRLGDIRSQLIKFEKVSESTEKDHSRLYGVCPDLTLLCTAEHTVLLIEQTLNSLN